MKNILIERKKHNYDETQTKPHVHSFNMAMLNGCMPTELMSNEPVI